MGSDKKEPVVKDFGWANGWAQYPERVIKCGKLGHKTIERKIGSHAYEVRCDQCGYVYKYDSS